MTKQTPTHAGSVVLVTGGAKGIGRGISERFLAAGAAVVVCGRKQPDELPSVDGRSAEFVSADVRDNDAAEAMVDDIVARHGRLDVLVNNAGGSPFAMADATSPRFSEAIIRLNLLAPMHLAQLANRHMQAQDSGGVVLFIGSIGGMRPSPGTSAYGAAKAGILNLTRSLAIEWAPKVRVAAVSPGLIRTEQAHQHYGDEEGIASVAATIPAGRMGQPEEIGDACVWLASDQAGFSAGTNLLLDGGGEMPSFLAEANVNQE